MPLIASKIAACTRAAFLDMTSGEVPAVMLAWNSTAFQSPTSSADAGADSVKNAPSTAASHGKNVRARIRTTTRVPFADRPNSVFIRPPGRVVFGRASGKSWDDSGIFVEVLFGPFSLHPFEGLRRCGRELHVTPKSLSVLCFLASHPGKVVAKDDLVRAVWQDVSVSYSALTSCIKE